MVRGRVLRGCQAILRWCLTTAPISSENATTVTRIDLIRRAWRWNRVPAPLALTLAAAAESARACLLALRTRQFGLPDHAQVVLAQLHDPVALEHIDAVAIDRDRAAATAAEAARSELPLALAELATELALPRQAALGTCLRRGDLSRSDRIDEEGSREDAGAEGNEPEVV